MNALTPLERPALLDCIARHRQARLVVVRAPAGFGKSTLLSQLRQRLQGEGCLCVSLTLDMADNDVSRFVQRLHAALDPRSGDAATPAALLQRIARIELPFVLLLDDVERLQEGAVLGLVREMLGHLPVHGRLVLASRSRPDLGLGRLRARGELLEIETAALRFSEDETRHYFAAQPLIEIDAEALLRLHRKTEGWPAGLAMAASVLQRLPAGNDFMRRLCANDEALAGYLREAVLEQLGFETQQLLLRASILRRLEPDLCDCLLPGADSRRILEGLAGDMFLVSEAEGGWRLHGLFADVLRERLHKTQPDLALRLHLGASSWYEQQGRLDDAVEHALAGGDLPHAVALLNGHVERVIGQGHMRTLARWLAQLPAAHVRADAQLRVASLWAETFTRGPIGALRELDALVAETGDPLVRAHASAMRPLLLAMLDRYEEAAQLPLPTDTGEPGASPFAAVVHCNAMAHVLAVAGEPGRSMRLLDHARGAPRGGEFARLYTEAVEGQIDLAAGRVRQASARLRLAAGGQGGQGDSHPYNHAHGNVWAGVLYAATVYESDQLEQAQLLLNACRPLVRDLALPDHMIIGQRLGARIAFQHGEVDAAFAQLKELEYLGHHRQLARVVAAARLEIGWLRLRQGHALAAREAIAQAAVPGVWERVARLRLPAHHGDDLLIAQARWEIHFGSPQGALDTLHAELSRDGEAGRGRRALTLRVLRMLALHRAGEVAAALLEARSVLPLACHEMCVRLLLDEGPVLAPLLQRVHADWPADDPIVAEYLQRLLASLGAAEAAPEPANAVAAPPPTLTKQEVKVLQLLADGYSNGAMAEKLFVSDSTVRTHLRSINLKLGAHSRSQAVAAARRLAVIR